MTLVKRGLLPGGRGQRRSREDGALYSEIDPRDTNKPYHRERIMQENPQASEQGEPGGSAEKAGFGGARVRKCCSSC